MTTPFTQTIETLEVALQTIRDISGVDVDSLNPKRLAGYQAQVEQVIATWEGVPEALRQALQAIRDNQAQRDMLAKVEGLSPEQRAEMQAIFANREEGTK
jgi:hypothetical protein